MKKLLSITISIVLLCTIVGCNRDDFTLDASAKNTAKGEELGYFTPFGLEWGMSEDEVFSALDQEKSTFDLIENTKPLVGELNSIVRYYQKKARIMGEEVALSLSFFNSAPSNVARLSSVRWIYQRDITQEEFNELCLKVEEMLLKQNVSLGKLMMITGENDTITAEIRSTATLKDLPESIKKDYAEGFKFQAEKFAENSLDQTDRIIISDDPLSQMSTSISRFAAIFSPKAEDKKSVCSFSLSGNYGGFLNVLALKSDLGSQSTPPSSEPVVSSEPPSSEPPSSEPPSSEPPSSEPPSSEEEKVEIFPTIGNTKWGMSPAQAFEALGTVEADWEKLKVGDNQKEEEFFSSSYAITDFEIYGIKAAAVVLNFSKVDDLGLISGKITYEAGNEELNSEFCNELISLYGEPKGYEPKKSGNDALSWTSPAVTLKQWDEGKLFEKYLIAQNAIRKEVGMQENDLSRLAVSKFDYYSFCTATNYYRDNNDISPVSSIGFDGFYAALFDIFDLKK